MGTELAVAILALALAIALVFMARSHAEMVRVFGTLSRNHREDNRALTNFAINTSRVYANEFLRAAIKGRIVEIDEAVTNVQNTIGGDRADAVAHLLATMEREEPNGESS